MTDGSVGVNKMKRMENTDVSANNTLLFTEMTTIAAGLVSNTALNPVLHVLQCKIPRQ